MALLKVLSSHFSARKTQQMSMTKWMLTFMKTYNLGMGKTASLVEQEQSATAPPLYMFHIPAPFRHSHYIRTYYQSWHKGTRLPRNWTEEQGYFGPVPALSVTERDEEQVYSRPVTACICSVDQVNLFLVSLSQTALEQVQSSLAPPSNSGATLFIYAPEIFWSSCTISLSERPHPMSGRASARSSSVCDRRPMSAMPMLENQSTIDDVKVRLALYVDDGMLISTCAEILPLIIIDLKAQFEVKEENCNYFVGIEIKRDIGEKIRKCFQVNKDISREY
uniref:Uncharacterized protein n=1 Tax=Timema cristinae TaxID=61476 RepID=A0A7R9CIA7_TIMCR|nr:unnamed protein product [Timema cristinae]